MVLRQRNRKSYSGDAKGGTLSNGVTPKKLVSLLQKKRLTLSVAESCTGGLICRKLTANPGVSRVFREGIVCYSDTSKIKRLSIGKGVIKRYGAVSADVCRLMARNITRSEKADLGIAVTGIAGPSGATAIKPIGLVYIGVNVKGRVTVHKYNFKGNRKVIQEKAARMALELLMKSVKNYLSRLPAEASAQAVSLRSSL